MKNAELRRLVETRENLSNPQSVHMAVLVLGQEVILFLGFMNLWILK